MLSLLLFAGAAFALNCTSNIAKPVAKGVQITDLTASQIANFGSQGNDVCFFTVTLTHPGTNDSVKNLYVFPLNNYNNRFQGQGGGGWAAGNPLALAPAAAAGYAAGTTDAGHELSIAAAQNASWGLLSPGNVDQYGLLNFAHRSVHDMTVLGKSLANNFYGKAPCKSYWNGCSNGGRQGLQSAQLYPEDYDGILANAPAIQYTSLLTYGAWSWSVLTDAKYFPDLCELEYIGNAVVAACDELDGVKDGIISAPGLCTWQPRSALGQNFTCNGSPRKVSQQLVSVVEKVWEGPRTRGKFLWWGLLRGAAFTGVYMNKDTGAVENTPRPFTASDSWLKAFIAKDWAFNTSNIPLDSYADIFLKAHLEYDSILGTASPNLKPFKQRGGKIITWQGLADQLVNPQGTIQYYQGVEALDPSVHDFYRLYFSPGVGHCFGGTGVQPIDAVGQLRAWVENGTAPATLKASSTYGVGNGTRFMDLCPWPATQKYNGGDPNKASSYSCATQKGWLDFAGPNGRGYNFFTAPGWYGGESSITAGFP